MPFPLLQDERSTGTSALGTNPIPSDRGTQPKLRPTLGSKNVRFSETSRGLCPRTPGQLLLGAPGGTSPPEHRPAQTDNSGLPHAVQELSEPDCTPRCPRIPGYLQLFARISLFP